MSLERSSNEAQKLCHKVIGMDAPHCMTQLDAIRSEDFSLPGGVKILGWQKNTNNFPKSSMTKFVPMLYLEDSMYFVVKFSRSCLLVYPT
jgi:hypothetical protein